jgi:hypothetical protein
MFCLPEGRNHPGYLFASAPDDDFPSLFYLGKQ